MLTYCNLRIAKLDTTNKKESNLMSEFILNNLLNPNEYTQKYYNLIQTNKYRKPEKYKT